MIIKLFYLVLLVLRSFLLISLFGQVYFAEAKVTVYLHSGKLHFIFLIFIRTDLMPIYQYCKYFPIDV